MPRKQPERGIDYWIRQQEKFMDERGTTFAGYVNFYTSRGETDIERIEAIYRADRAYLRNLLGRRH